MATSMKRFMISIPKEMEKEVDEIKKGRFYNKAYAEVYRYLLKKGIEAYEKEKQINAR